MDLLPEIRISVIQSNNKKKVRTYLEINILYTILTLQFYSLIPNNQSNLVSSPKKRVEYFVL